MGWDQSELFGSLEIRCSIAAVYRDLLGAGTGQKKAMPGECIKGGQQGTLQSVSVGIWPELMKRAIPDMLGSYSSILYITKISVPHKRLRLGLRTGK